MKRQWRYLYSDRKSVLTPHLPLQVKTKKKEKTRTCQMDIIRVRCLLGPGKKKQSFSGASHRIFMTFRLFCSTLDRDGF